MRKAQVFAGAIATLAIFASGSAKADGGTVVLNTFNDVLPKMIGDGLGPKKTDGSPRVGKNTGVGYMDSQVKIDDSVAAKANFATEVPLLITATRTSNTAVNTGGNPSYMQGAFSVVKLTSAGPQLSTMQEVDLPQLNGERNWQKPNIVATDKYYLLVAASEDNGNNNNPQVVAFVYDKTTLQPVKVLNTNRGDSTKKPTNLIQLSGKQDGQQYGPHSIARVAPNSFVMGVQRNNQNAYVMRVTVDETPATGVNLQVNYLTRVIDNARHCRPEVTSDGYLTSVEANNQPADIGVRLLKFDLNTGKVLNDASGKPMSILVAKSSPGNNKYAVQPNIADLGNYIGVTYQMSEKTRGAGGHTGGSNLSMAQVFDKATLKPMMATPSMAVAPYARHAAGTATLWGEEGKEMQTLVSLGGSSIGTGKGFAQMIPLDQTGALGTKDPAKLYEVSRYSDIAGTIVRGKRNPNDQGRGFIYALGGVPNPGFNGGATAFMPEVKTFMASAVSGYTSATTATQAARESIWLSLVPSTWKAGLQTTPGQATPTPGTNPDGTGPLPRTDAPATNPSPGATEPGSVIPGGDSPTPPGDDPNFGGQGGGCSVSSTNASTGATGGIFLALGLALLGLRRKGSKQEEA